ncbi:hypothetical protein LS482_18915 [Sinomicrobium kalidii]|uniref:MauE/DoxX family redox-associated membrane protein n=1 Tax=Sinomicrobium kalidii TaxID=2900738 RepID=UPI001E4A8505|nr:MauE/DoxX family redox-associated membrane protein [Sinomicrobium kalidii]UGU15739.1 hypothetical protein LS482_18915 [Sinomicrobium kalidii]
MKNSISNYIVRYRKIFMEIIAFLLVILFMYTGMTKLLDHTQFYYSLINSPLFEDKSLISFISSFIPIVEIIIALCIAFPKTRLKGLYGAFILMCLFTVYVGGILVFSPNRPCSCGGVISSLDWGEHLIFNVCFTLLALTGILLHRRNNTNTSLTNTTLLKH